MAAGRVCTGFSKPYVAVYSETSGAVSYSDAMELARGVSVNIEPEQSDENIFYANNQAAESAGGIFTGGTITLTVDGLKGDAEELIFGLPEAGSDGWRKWGNGMSVPYVGVGYVARYIEDGVESFVPTIIRKVKFEIPSTEHATAEEEIDWQTQELTGSIFRDDTSDKAWRWTGAEQTTEAAAVAKIEAALGVVPPGP